MRFFRDILVSKLSPYAEEDDPYLITLQSLRTLASVTPAVPCSKPQSTTRQNGVPTSRLTARPNLFSHTKSNSIPVPLRKPPSRAASTSTSTAHHVRLRPATVAATATVTRPTRTSTRSIGTRGGVTSASASVARSVGTLSTRSSIRNLSSLAEKSAPVTKAKGGGLTAAGARETKASLARAMVRIRHIGGEAAAEASRAMEKSKAGAAGVRKVALVKSAGGKGLPVKVGGGNAKTQEEEGVLVLKFDDLEPTHEEEEFRFQL